jgi:hypothetical protein
VTGVWVANDDGTEIVRARDIAVASLDYDGNVNVRLAGGDGLRHGGEDLQPRIKAGKAQNGGHQGRGGGQAQDTAQQAGAAGNADQHGKPARIAEGHPGQIDDEPTGTRPQQAEKMLTPKRGRAMSISPLIVTMV